ncbi:MAG TPA: glycosyltransferase [Candidatus Eisenbergiella merdipullorum]|uniref:Glycosyltransferase n=1 Tax=Candidatus Eisenbergiella merdipullorum TaxID=2838553 RepID=A0A9D2KZK9_9FIRM|nr:glycosyltransferase [Candidatus Eisenbergiella merdipullorum]
MKVVLINTVANTGSTGKIVTALYRKLEQESEDACIVYGRGKCNPSIKSYKTGSGVDFLLHVLRNFFRGESGFGSEAATRKLIAYLEEEKPDIIHLHNIHGFYLQCEILFEYIKRRNIPVIWTLHDCWPFTGHCAFFDHAGCRKWETGCERCERHRSAYPYALFCDNSREAYARKKAAFQGVKDLTVVTPSRWLKGLVKKSFLMDYPVKVIYNGIDLKAFFPEKGRKAPSGRYLILGVANVWEKRKGLAYFKKLAKMLDERYRIVLVGLNIFQRIGLKAAGYSRITAMGRTQSAEELRRLYGSAAVYVNTTLEDNFPTTNLEALSCGTPVITFRTGGSPESVDEDCGIVVEKGNVEELKAAVEEICAHPERYPAEKVAEKAQSFRKERMAEDYIKLYRKKLLTSYRNGASVSRHA